jgi:multidrug efflux system membrane fusion protein
MIRPASASIAVSLAVLAAGCGAKGDAQAARRPVPVRVAQATEKDVPVEIRAVGKIVASQSVAIRAQVGGTLLSAHFAEGKWVKKGDLLLEIDRRPYQAALAEAKGRLEQDRARAANAADDARRYADLVEKEFVTRQQYEAAKANATSLEAAVVADQAAVQRAALNLSWCTLRAPVSGRTGRILVHPGNLVSASSPEPLVTIEQVKPVYAQFAIPERHLAALRARRDSPPPATIRTAAGGPGIAGSLEFVDNAVDASTGTILLKARVANEDEALWPGQVVDVSLRVAERARAVVVPTSAVAAGQQGDYAYVVNAERKAELRPVVVEIAGSDETVIGKGVAAGETVVTEGQLRLRPDAAVEILDAPKGPGK